MFNPPYKSLLCILCYTLLFSSEYNTLYLMEFENSSKDFKIDYLRTQLPELVKYKYSNKGFEIQYSPNLVSSLNDYETTTLKDGVLLYGKYSSSIEDIIVSFEVYDVETWKELSSRSYRCKSNDFECIEKAFYVCVEDEVISLFCDRFDCAGVCNGFSVEDCAGECNGSALLDCNGVCNGDSFFNECSQCIQVGNDEECKQDCNEVWGGNAFYNECNICINEESELDVGKDCLGVCGGTATLDCNGECNGPSYPDCSGECGGFAYFNECNVCVGGTTDNPYDKGLDCNGICFGDAMIDDCGVCEGNNESCSDCSGTAYGSAYTDECGICDLDPGNDCKMDCNNNWGGESFINECLVCVGGNTGITINAGLDCSGTCWGTSELDECEVCNGPGPVFECGCHNILNGACDCLGNFNDCMGTCGGNAFLDECNVCNGDGELCKNKEQADVKSDDSVLEISLNPILDKIGLKNNSFDRGFCLDCPSNTEKEENLDFSQFNNSDKKQNNTNKFLYIVDEFFNDAYNVFVKDIEIETFVEDDMVMLKIPIEYSLKNDLIKTLFNDVTHIYKTNENGTYTIELSRDSFHFEKALENYFSMMKYQIVPVIFLMNDLDEVKHIHVDSWGNNYNFVPIEMKNDINITVSNSFKPLFSITPGEHDIQLNLDPSTQISNYNLLLSIKDFQEYDYTKLSVKFIYENELEVNINSYASNR